MNKQVARLLNEIADLLEVQGDRFRPRAYRRAARQIETLSEDIQEIYERGDVEGIPWVGSGIAKKIAEFLSTGHLKYLNELRREVDPGLSGIIEIEGIGPKTALLLYETLNINTVEGLEKAAKEGRLRGIKGLGDKTEENILKGIERHRKYGKRFLLGFVLPIALQIEERLREVEGVGRVSLAGSIRRRKDSIGDIDVLATSSNPQGVMNAFTSMPSVVRVLAKGDTKSSVVLEGGPQVDLRVVDEESFGSALQYFTGSKEHNIALRGIAVKRGWKLSEYSLEDRESGEKIAGETEASIYSALSMKFIPPELRENRGEIQSAIMESLPQLIEYKDVRGDLHVHTKWSDGSDTIMEMVERAKTLGLEYLAICDHSPSLKIARGLSLDDLMKQTKEIEYINRKIEGFRVLKGIEVDIKGDGSLDSRNETLKDLDFVVASVHTGFKMDRKQMTNRIITALHNDYVDVLGHPTGRLIQQREGYDIDLNEIFTQAADLKVLMEINAFPSRLDLSDVNCRTARDRGVIMCIGSDAHSVDQLKYLELGVATARRGWIEKEDVINTLPLHELQRRLR
jgi:DNA polymerase (family 10)